MSIFEGARTQYIDDNGKTRMLTFKFQGKILSFMTSPIPPLDLPNERTISEVPLNVALKFIKEKGLRIVSQDGSKEAGIKGLWIEMKEENPLIYYGYIPVEQTDALDGYDFAEPTKNDPLRVNPEESDLQKFRKSRKIAEFLKKYTLYTYALNADEFDVEAPTWFVVNPNHAYDIEKLNKKLYVKKNDVIYDSSGYIIVPTQETADKLLSYLRIQLVSNKPGVLALADVKTVEDYYQTVSDFRSSENQLIFTSAESVKRWKKEASRVEGTSNVSQNLLPYASEPYFYKTPKIANGRLHIVQNVKSGKLEDATAVSYKWIKDKVNIGYNITDTDKIAMPNDVPYRAYTNSGLLLKHGMVKDGASVATVIFYDDNESYGAVLFLA